MSLVREHIVKNYQSYAPRVLGGKRSSSWPRVRKVHIQRYEPVCVACGSKKKLQVHHIEDFSTNPELELDHDNLLTLCMTTRKCHFLIGHLAHWKSINLTVLRDALYIKERYDSRRK